MAKQQVEFEFPDPDNDDAIEVEIEPSSVMEPLDFDKSESEEVETKEGETKEGEVEAKDEKPAKEYDVAGFEIEVVNDVPSEDRNRKASDPPEALTDEELNDYSEKVARRIKHFNKVYHDERRSKEQAMRESMELRQLTKQLLEENNSLKIGLDRSNTGFIAQAKANAQARLEIAQKKYKEAYETGESDKVLEAQEELTQATITMDKSKHWKPTPLQQPKDDVQSSNVPQSQPAEPAQQIQVDERAQAWSDENEWFGQDEEMTALALGTHNKLIKQGVDPRSDTYYERLNARMRQVFPSSFDDVTETKEPEVKAKSKPSENVVAPATRSTGPKKVKLSETAVKLARELNIPLEVYAKSVLETANNERNR